MALIHFRQIHDLFVGQNVSIVLTELHVKFFS